ncbi:anthranilate synthase component II [Bacteroides sp. UBA939]|uniref:anthranilate synthase component II n=1 Tax=Bacteroides sp. UBA939 TaxID=1946092 RepID=UPI0025C03757|nr:aminodeoxychorismate/anthranilate synthase component II [Bacteroides sp. UBA939]
MKTVIIDNYDSFTYNLAHIVKELGAEVDVLRNDCFALEDIERYDKIILSPGPGIPEEAGLLLDVIRTYAGRKPMLGVCLGEQAIGQIFGGRLVNLSEVFHGVQTRVVISDEGLVISDSPLNANHSPLITTDYLFSGLPAEILVGRYHSWVVDIENLPEELVVTAISPEGQIMALKHRDYDIHGIQFHPESVLTPDGKTIVQNWLYHKG